MKTNELTGTALDWAVAEANHLSPFIDDHRTVEGAKSVLIGHRMVYTPSTNWAQGGPIVEREGISLLYQYGDGYEAYRHTGHTQKGETPLIAAMRCYCCAKLGDEVEIPEELI